MHYPARIFPAVLIVILLCACNGQREVYFDGESMGTFYTVKYIDSEGANHQEAIDSALKAVNDIFSTYLEESEISRINNSDGPVHVSPEFANLLQHALEFAALTDGALEPTIFPLVNLWGFAGGERRRPEQDAIDSVLAFTGYELLKLRNDTLYKGHPDVQLDLNALAKGYGVDQMGQVMEANGVKNYLVGIGGDMRARGKNSAGNDWTVGIETPVDGAGVGEEIFEIVSLENRSLATSGDYRNFFEEDGQKYAHIIDPHTGYPAKSRVLSATIIHKTCMKADAMATASVAMGLEAAESMLRDLPEYAYYLVYENENGELTARYSDELEEVIK